MNNSPLLLAALLLAQAGAAGCAGSAERMDEQAQRLGFLKKTVPGAGYEHVVYLKPEPINQRAVLHVYLDGDGTPWIRNNLPAPDPTPRKPVMLELMALDDKPSLYLGRPCYHGLRAATGCTPDLWTTARYSEKVVASMAAAIERQTADYPGIVLLGFSGGGTLAMLIAQRLPKTVAVITVAANLDTARWAA